MRYSSYSFLISVLDWMSGQRHALAALHPRGKDSGTHWTADWVGLRAGLDTEARGNILCLCWRSNSGRPVVQCLVRHCTDWATPAIDTLTVPLNGLKSASWIKCGLTQLQYRLFWSETRINLTIINWVQSQLQKLIPLAGSRGCRAWKTVTF
jgi:hypothetical protein